MKVSTTSLPESSTPCFAIIAETETDRTLLAIFLREQRKPDKDLAFFGYTSEIGKGTVGFNFGIGEKGLKEKPTTVFWSIFILAFYGISMLALGYEICKRFG